MTDSREEMNGNNDSEFVDEEEAEGDPAALAKLRAKLKKAIEEKQEYLEGWQRARADLANFKREEALIHHDREARIKSTLIESLIPALDALELALKHEKEGQNGLEMIYKQFLTSLKNMRVERYGTVGDAFTPHKYEALREVVTDNQAQDHTVESVERSGYRVGERVIRPAQVAVFAFKP
ncbi:MAG: nucleotide exchange factor GrpE [Minisyncoccia bacterium]|jgi:molecular chaperone GrpE